MQRSSIALLTGLIGFLGCSSDESPSDAAVAPAAAPPTVASVDEPDEVLPETEVRSFVADRTGLSPTEQIDSVALFDGESLFGWHGEGFVVDEGRLVTAGESKTPAIVTDAAFGDVEYRGMVELTDGAVFAIAAGCDDSGEGGRTVAIAAGKSADSSTPSAVVEADVPVAFTLRVDGSKATLTVDGQTLDVIADGAGPIAGHLRISSLGGTAAVSQLRANPLNGEPILDESLAGWFVNGETEVAGGEDGVRITGGLGFLVSEATYKDFVLQTRVTVHTEKTNSGVFFRAMKPSKPTESNGYEMQVSPEYEEDRTKPVDAGAGAIFRRQDARRVLLDVDESTTLTLAVSSDRIVTWVGGYPVVSFQDERDDDPNPRRGRRLDAGHFLLQGHDPGTDVTYEWMRISAVAD